MAKYRGNIGRSFSIGDPGPMQVPTDVSVGRRLGTDGKKYEWHAGWTIIKNDAQRHRAIRNYFFDGDQSLVMTLRYPARPVMRPALEKSKEKLVSFFQDSLF